MDVPTKRLAFHIFVRLIGNAVYHQDALVRLKGALPSCTRAVIADADVVVLATITEDSEIELLERCKAALQSYRTITVVELGRLSASTDGTFDPFHDWMHCNVRHGTRGQGYDPEDMLKAKWAKRRSEDSEHSGVADAIRKVFPGTWPRRNHR
jgi:hypothetical protein